MAKAEQPSNFHRVAEFHRAFSLPVAIGDTGPVDTQLWPLDYPFACATEDSGLSQPLVDNQQGAGTPVTSADGEALGFSQDCQIATRAL